MHYPVKHFLPHIILFSVYVVALVPMLYYYRRRQPHHRFRPSLGEMTMITVFALVVGGTACWFLGNVFRGDQNINMSVPDHGAGWSGGSSGPQDSGGEGGGNYRRE